MKFKIECDDMDGVVLMDENTLEELNSELLYSMDILLDYEGDSELIYDFPEEKWSEVRAREKKLIEKFCNSGKMIIWLMNSTEKECTFEEDANILNTKKYLHVTSGKIIMVTASELIQCVSYPELELEKIFEKNIESGWYAISSSTDKIIYCKRDKKIDDIINVQEEYIFS